LTFSLGFYWLLLLVGVGGVITYWPFSELRNAEFVSEFYSTGTSGLKAK